MNVCTKWRDLTTIRRDGVGKRKGFLGEITDKLERLFFMLLFLQQRGRVVVGPGYPLCRLRSGDAPRRNARRAGCSTGQCRSAWIGKGQSGGRFGVGTEC